MRPDELDGLAWEKQQGLLPAIVQDANNSRVLMLGYMSREALSATPDWGVVGSRLGLLAALALVMGWLATRAFGVYQRSV